MVEALADATRRVTTEFAPGDVVVVLGQNLVAAGTGPCSPNVPLPTREETCRVSVAVGGKAAAFFFAAAFQLSLQFPWDLELGPGELVVTVDGAGSSQRFALTIQKFAPTINEVTVDFIPAISRGDGGFVTAANPAIPGETLFMSAAGLGRSTNDPAVGALPGGFAAPLGTARVLLGPAPEGSANPAQAQGEIEATVFQTFLGGVPGFYSVIFKVPFGLAPGDYLLELEMSDPETGESARSQAVQFPVGEPPLVGSPRSLSFSFVQLSEAAIRRLFVSNTTSDSLPFQVAVTTQSGGPWLSVTPENGDVTPDAAVALTVRADPGGLPPGTYLGEIRISSSAIPQVTVVPVTMAISRRQQLLRLSQTGATFIALSGTGPVAPRSFRVLNDGLGLLQWNITPTTLSGGPWLSAEPAVGMTNAASSSAVEIRVDPTGLEAGVYYGIVEVAAPEAASSPQFVTVVLPLLAPGSDTLPAVFPTGLLFAASENGPAPDSQAVQITNLTSSALSFTSSRSTEDGNDWFVHTPTGAAVPPAGMVSIDVQADPTGLAAGIYRGTLSLSFDDGSTATVDLVFVVAAAETTNLKQAGRLQNACQRSELVPVFQVLGTTSAIPAAWPARIEVGVVDNCGNPMQEGLVEVEFRNIASPNLALGRLEPGVWSGTWDVPNTDQQVDGSVTATATDAAGLTGSFTASVALAPNAAPAPQVNTGGVVHAASFVAEPLAPGTIISIFGSALSREPTNTPGELAPSLPLPTDLAGTEITIGGVLVPLIFSREDQVNAVIPFELLDRANETLPVLVHRIGARSVSVSEPVLVTAARPGVFTLNATGRGAAVIQDVNFQTVTAFNPVAPGDVIQIFCTGLGPVEPEVPTGAAAPLSPLSWVVEEVEVTIGGVPATVQFAGLTPGFAGLYQINAFVPEGISLGQPQLVVSIAGQESLVVTVAVR